MQITRCPNCATSFKVTPDQLRQASGWVRCGRCRNVFEALLHTAPTETPIASEPATPRDVPANPPAHQRRAPLWLLMSVVLAVLLIAQVAWMGRHLVYAQIPALQPALHAVCELFHCEVTWPRSLDAVVIESSSFSEAPGGGYVVHLRLRNTATYFVATPALELSLLDLQDQVVLRRVFKQDELHLNDRLLPLREVRAQVYFDLEAGASEGIAGFRALVFYP